MAGENQNGGKNAISYWKNDLNATYGANFELFLDAVYWVLTQKIYKAFEMLPQ
jgi:hypothetical protein